MLEAREPRTEEEGWTRPAPGTAGLRGTAPRREGLAGVWGACLCCAANQLCGFSVAGAPLGILETDSPGVRPGRGHSASACHALPCEQEVAVAALLLLPFMLSFLLPVLNSLLPLSMPWLLLLLFFTVRVVSQESSFTTAGSVLGAPARGSAPLALLLSRACCQPSAAGLLPASLHLYQRLLQAEPLP